MHKVRLQFGNCPSLQFTHAVSWRAICSAEKVASAPVGTHDADRPLHVRAWPFAIDRRSKVFRNSEAFLTRCSNARRRPTNERHMGTELGYHSYVLFTVRRSVVDCRQVTLPWHNFPCRVFEGLFFGVRFSDGFMWPVLSLCLEMGKARRERQLVPAVIAFLSPR